MEANCPIPNTFPVYDSIVVNITLAGFWLLMAFLLVLTFRTDRRHFVLLIMAFTFGYSIEYIGVSQNLYDYLRGFFYLKGCVPVYIPLGWAFIFYASYITSSRLFDNWVHVGLFSGILAVSLDFLMDPGAAGLYLWHWRQEFTPWYGVPWNNFVGWFMIIFCLSSACSLVEQRLSYWGNDSKALVGRAVLSILLGYLLISVLFSAYLFGGGLIGVADSPLRDTIYNTVIFATASFHVARALPGKRVSHGPELHLLLVPWFIIAISLSYLLMILIYDTDLPHDYHSLLFLFPFLAIGILLAFRLPYKPRIAIK